MTSEQWTLVKSVFSEALEIDPRLRDEWLSHRAELPPSVVAEVLRLLAASESVTHLAPPDFAECPLATPGQLVGQTLLSRFEVVSLLGSGAMGDVYCAYDRRINEAVAFKTIRPHLAQRPEVIASLTREVALARRVVHANVCQIRDLHQEPNPPIGPLLFFTMELLPGRTLAAQLAERALTLPETLEIARGIASGIAAIHSRSLIHRDLKPSNVFLVSSETEAPRAVITDFGLCFDEHRAVAETLSVFGPEAIVGTPAYMAPEQLLGKGATQQSDIYAFGVLLFEMVTGRLPFPGETPLAIALRRLQDEAPEARSIVKQLPADWNRAIAACLERAADRRPTSALEVIAALDGIKRINRSVLSRRTILVAAASAVVGTGGLITWRHEATKISPPNPAAERHLKLAQEYSRQSSTESIQSAVAELQSAVAIDPKYGEAWANLADVYCLASTYAVLESKQARKLAENAALKALELDSSLGKAHAAYAYCLSADIHRWRNAEPVFKKAISLSPSEPSVRSGYAGLLGRQGRAEEAIAMAQSALQLDPGSFRWNYRVAAELLRARKFDQLLAHMKTVVHLHPAEVLGFCTLGRTYEWLRHFDEARAALQQADLLPGKVSATSYWATFYAASGDSVRALMRTNDVRQRWLERKSETNELLSCVGALANLLGESTQSDAIVSILREGVRLEDETVLAAAHNPYLELARSDPKVDALYQQYDLI